MWFAYVQQEEQQQEEKEEEEEEEHEGIRVEDLCESPIPEDEDQAGYAPPAPLFLRSKRGAEEQEGLGAKRRREDEANQQGKPWCSVQ